MVVPSVSLPTTMKPFSARRIISASSPMSPPSKAGSFSERRARKDAARRCRNRELVGAVASEAYSRDPERRALECARREGHMRQALVVERDLKARGLDEIA